MGRSARPLAPRFWAKVQLDEPDKCWFWTAGKRGQYGCAWDGKNRVAAHRVAYELTIGPIPDGLEVCHSCDNPLCCNPQHLWPGTHKQNMEDRGRKKRGNVVHGSAHCNAKLSENDILKIRELYQQGQLSQRAIAKQFHVSQPNINYIVNQRMWVSV